MNGPVVVSDPNIPLPHKAGIYDNPGYPGPPGYQEKNPLGVQPTAPIRGQSGKKNYVNLDDLPAVPDSAPSKGNKSDEDDDDVSFDDLQKRFNNLKKS